MKNRKRDIEIFSLSFLDCICCGFGAIILLFVLSKFAEPVVIEKIKENMQTQIVRLENELFEIRGKTQILNREMTAKKEQLSQEKEKLARLQGDLSDVEGQFSASKDDAVVQNIIEGKLARARQELTEEMKANQPLRSALNPVLTEFSDDDTVVRITDQQARRVVDLGNSLYGLMLHTTAQVCAPAPLPSGLRQDLSEVSAELMRLVNTLGEAAARIPQRFISLLLENSRVEICVLSPISARKVMKKTIR